jgi:carboxymethylenebutenolidase
MPDTRYQAASAELGAYLAVPGGSTGPWPGVVVIQDSLGLSADIRAQADRLAGAGYLAFAPDLYSGRGIRCVLATIAASRTGRGPAYDDIEAARKWVAGHEDCTGTVGIIGFCMGGGFALLCAPKYDFAAASVNYGEVPGNAAERLRGTCPVVGSYGKRDPSLRGRAQRLERALEELGVDHDGKEYPDAGHSFMNKVKVPPGIDLLVPLLHFDYKHEASEDAWTRILAFFEKHLAGSV